MLQEDTAALSEAYRLSKKSGKFPEDVAGNAHRSVKMFGGLLKVVCMLKQQTSQLQSAQCSTIIPCQNLVTNS